MGGVWGLSGYPEVQTVGYRFREGHTLCTLNTSFVYFGKQYEHSSRYRSRFDRVVFSVVLPGILRRNQR
jgi:hypothetical protein